VLARKFNRFLQGDYQRDDHMRARFAPAVEGNRMSVDMVTGASVTTRLGAIYRTEYEWFGKPETISFMARIYLAEHDAEDMDWNTWGFDGMYHTSIIGGIWALNRRTRRVTSFIREQPSGAWDERATLAEFAGWRIGYGAASKYQPDDRLTLVTETTHSSWEEADRRLFGHTPSGGKYYPIRGVAYSKGNYGLDWVCHQTANAFSLRKWNLLPVTYPISWLPFGPYGNNGISTRRDLVGQIHKGCVPGVWCFYNVTPPYSIPDPVMVGVMESQMTGSGWGLETLWNPNKGWVRSEASFDPMAINCTVPASEVVAVERL
jgi:hypothetical protein